MAFSFSTATRYALERYGLNPDAIASLEQLEEQQRKMARALRVPSEASRLRRMARLLDKQSRRRRMTQPR